MKPRIYKHFGNLFVNVGWFSGEPFALFKLTIGQVTEGYPDGIDCITLFDIQVTKIAFCVGWSKA